MGACLRCTVLSQVAFVSWWQLSQVRKEVHAEKLQQQRSNMRLKTRVTRLSAALLSCQCCILVQTVLGAWHWHQLMRKHDALIGRQENQISELKQEAANSSNAKEI